MVTTIYIDDEEEFEKLKQFGSYSTGENKIYTTVGVLESDDSIEGKQVNFVLRS